MKPFKKYEKQVPDHRIQVDITPLDLQSKDSKKLRYYQYIAIDDATRARILKIYDGHTQQNAIHFTDYVLSRFPFRIHTIQIDPWKILYARDT